MAAPKAAAPASLDPRLADFDLKYIDKGAYGAVYKAIRKRDGREYALKQVDLSNMKRMDLAMARDEATLLSQLNHPHVIRYYDSFIDKDNRLNILMEYAAKGSVRTLIASYRGRPVPEDVVWRIAVQTLLGLQYLHSKKIIHRDIKAANLFLDSKDNIKIGDLGIARTLSASSNLAHTQLGTPYYLAPELCEDKPYNNKSDMWALGVVLYEACMGVFPFDVENKNTVALMRKIIRGQFKPVQGPYSSQLIQLVTACLTFKPESRPDATQLLRNPGLVSKANAQNLNLNPRPLEESASPLAPAPSAAPPPPAPPPQEFPGVVGPPGGHPFGGPGGGPPGPYGGAQQPPYQYQQQPPSPYSPYQRPASAGAHAGRFPQGPPAPGNHPFALPGQQGGGYGSPQQGYNPPGGQGYGSPQQGYNQPGGQGYGSPQPAAHNNARGSPYGQQQQGAPYAVQPQSPYGAWELADDVNRMQLHGSEVARNNLERQQAAQANMHAGKQDQAKNVIYGGAQDSGPKPQRVAPEVLPAAGQRPASARPAAAAPFAMHYPGNAAPQTQAHASMNEAWSASYQPPQYGRRRNPDLQITGPSLRTPGPRGGGTGGGGGYVPAADDATSYVSSTSYYTSYK